MKVSYFSRQGATPQGQQQILYIFFVIPRFFTGNIELNFVSWRITLHEEPFFVIAIIKLYFSR